MIPWIALAAPAPAGVLQGTLTDPDGLPVSGALVVAYDSRFRYLTVLTEPDGTWELPDVRPDTWRVRVLPSASDEVSERWEGDTLVACDATRFPVADGITWIDTVLPYGGSVRGRVLLPDGEPLATAEIRALPTWYREVSLAGRSALTGVDGRFEVTGLVPPPDGFPPSFTLELLAGDLLPGQFFQGAWTEDGANIVQVQAPESVSIGDMDVREGVTLAGTVFGPDGPVPAGTVTVTTAARTIQAPIAEDGTWTATGLRPGEILVWATSPGLGRTYWPNADRPGPRVLALDDGEVVLDVDLQMPAEARVRGQIVASGDLTQVSAVLVNGDGSVAHTAVLDESGVFVFPAVRSGSWALEVYGSQLGFVDGRVREASGAPLSIQVPEGESVDLGRVDVPIGASVSGTITALGSGGPVYGAAVIAELTGAAPVRRIAFTDPDGTYTLRGMGPGSWSLEVAYAPFCLTDPGWVSIGWPNTVDPDLAGRVDLDAGEAFTWDPVLPPDADNDQMDDLWEAANGLDPTVDDSDGDPDGDGFPNLVEYRLGTDPQQIYQEGCGCAGRGPGPAGPAALLLGVLLTGRRRGPAAR